MVVEVNTAPALPWSSIRHDLAKLEEFLAKYGFGKALFLITSNTPERIKEMFRSQHVRDWIAEHLPHRRQILVWCKEKRGATLWERNLGGLSDRPTV